MMGDMGSPLVRALVRGERVKRAYGPSSHLYRRWVDITRPYICAQMSNQEFKQAAELVDIDRRSRR